ncbi:Tetratricopeptide repeat protein [Rubripirellula amarantea]|uniref:Tetratricopeptide repeat protein n=1 Tax=Rubripirellula amarantea TaxID=2527999 RepID=A0A5C5WQU5_9BACT|nr:tetratricopeptide repeat protein [Rubripirellula amarantea]TWT52655.1 Tetratricopeptide repeat protein [Rubripirellula amarantea]
MMQYFNPLAWARWIRQFVYAWLLSIPWQSAAKASPAVATLIVILIVASVAFSGFSSWRNSLIAAQTETAWQNEDYATAELVIRRQLNMNRQSPDLLYRLGLARDSQEERDEATEIMRNLVRSYNHAPAAMWILRNVYSELAWAKLSKAERNELGNLLSLLSREAPKDPNIKRTYADYLITTGDEEMAIKLLSELAENQPMQGLRAAAVAKRLGKNRQSVMLAEQTLSNLQKRASEEPGDIRLSLAIAQNQIFLEKHPESVRTLQTAIANAKTPEEADLLRMSMSDAIVVWIGSIEKAPVETQEDKLQVLKMLQVALKFAPNNPRVLTLVADQVLATLDENDEQLKKIRNALVSGSSPGIAHFIRGTAALMKDDVERATTSLELAAKELPRSGAILNNLAVALSMRGDEHLERALKISEQAISTTPNATPHFYETRGQILFRLKRYQDAITDLELALSVPSLAPQAHLSLAVCYRELGEPELAKMHEEAAKTTASASEPTSESS